MADQTKLRKRLEALLKKPENQACADCGKRGPRWASANLGNFFCIECSGIHRNLGVHISFVRSVNLDTWTLKQVEFMEEWGNARANAYYEAKLPRDYVKPRENDPVRVVEKFIREKYEQKRFIADSIPPPNSSSASSGVAAEPEPVKEVRRSVATPVASTRTAAAPVAPAPFKAAAPPKEEPNLLDFFDSPPAVAAAPAAPPAPVQQADPFQVQGGFPSQPNNFFGNTPTHSDPFFGGGSQAPPPAPQQQQQQQFQQTYQHQQQQQQSHQQFQDPFFSTPTSQPEFAQAPPAPPKASADAILSLYSTAPSHPHQHQHQGGMQHNSHAQGISMMMPPGPQHGHHPMGMGMGMPRGMPPQMGGFGAPQYGGGMGGGMYPPQQPQYPGMMGGGMQHLQQQPQHHFPQQHPHGMGMGGQSFPPQNGFGMQPQQQQQPNGMYPSQQRGW